MRVEVQIDKLALQSSLYATKPQPAPSLDSAVPSCLLQLPLFSPHFLSMCPFQHSTVFLLPYVILIMNLKLDAQTHCSWPGRTCFEFVEHFRSSTMFK